MIFSLLSCFTRRAVCALVVVLALSACDFLAPRGVQPDPQVANYWPETTWDRGRPAGGQPATALHWRDYFVAPELVALVDTALQNNRDLRLALLRVEEARAVYGIQRAAQFPSLAVAAQGARSRVPGDLNVSGRSVVASEYQAYAGVSSWELDLWGRVRSLKEAALQEYLATEEAQRAARITLIAAVAQAYLGLWELDARIALAGQTVASREESYRIFRRRNEVGAVSTLELTQVETLLNTAHALLAQLQQARALQAHALTQLLGVPQVVAPLAAEHWPDEAVFAPLRVGLPAELLTARPDIRAAEKRLAAAQANVQAARAAFFPRIALTGSLGTASAQLDGLFASGSRAWTFVPSISLPIFDGGLRQAGLDLAAARSHIAVANYERTVQQAFREVADALSARQWLTQQLAIQQQSLATQQQRARLAQLRYDNGATSYLDVLDAQRDLLEAQQQSLQVRRRLLASQVDLYTVLGGGSEQSDGSSAELRAAPSSP